MKRLRKVHIFSLFFVFLFFSPFIASADDAAVPGKTDIGIIVPPRVFFEVVPPAETGTTVGVPMKPGSAVSAPEKAAGNSVLPEKSPLVATASEQAGATATASLIDNYDQNKTASKAVKQNLGLFSTRIREKFSQWLSRSGKYLDLMKDILKKKDIPEDMVFLSLIESGFNPYAYSIASADRGSSLPPRREDTASRSTGGKMKGGIR
jgi:hypothetical protein